MEDDAMTSHAEQTPGYLHRNNYEGSVPLARLELPIGTGAEGTRLESDSLGEIPVPAEHYWGAETQRSLTNSSIGDDHIPKAVYHAYGYVKKAAAAVNWAAETLPRWKAEIIGLVADEVISGKLDAEFPLYVWQSGSGTHVNMNVNEVIANRANQLTGAVLGRKQPFHPHDDVNLGQSSNDTFLTALHIAVVREIDLVLQPALERLICEFRTKSRTWSDVLKIGRTHLQDAVPLTVGQEWSGYESQLETAATRMHAALDGLYEIPMGGTAVGTGLNSPVGFGAEAATLLSRYLDLPIVSAPNKFAALAGLDSLVRAMGGVKGVAIPLLKIANDIRWLASGPRCGLGELKLPANEPGSSIMPGKVNPTQCEALMMVCIQVLCSDMAVTFAATQGNFELNTMRPVVAFNLLHSIRILGDACDRFREYCIAGIALDRARIADHVQRSLMLGAWLSPVLGYDRAATIVRKAADEDLTLREAVLETGALSPEQFDEIVNSSFAGTSGGRSPAA
jgi:fumarate hydratase class II